MKNYNYLRYLCIAALFVAVSCSKKETPPPNIVIIFSDDQGYSDVGVFGAKGFKTPNLDVMASEGMKFTDFYVGSPVCSPSRAALLTGCYPQRVGIPQVLFPERMNMEWDASQTSTKTGINPDEITMAEMLKANMLPVFSENGILGITNNSYRCNKGSMNIMDCHIQMTCALVKMQILLKIHILDYR
jgi:hypothetical protein